LTAPPDRGLVGHGAIEGLTARNGRVGRKDEDGERPKRTPAPG
jgi:hypothetical protein